MTLKFVYEAEHPVKLTNKWMQYHTLCALELSKCKLLIKATHKSWKTTNKYGCYNYSVHGETLSANRSEGAIWVTHRLLLSCCVGT